MVLAAILLAVATATAAPHVHTVAAGESAASLAKRFYGDPDLGELLLRYNGKPDKTIHPGERLTIPFCEVYRARPGDTWSALAKRHLGRATASSVLAELNGYAAGQPLRVGSRIVFPVVLGHTLARGETLSSLAERFYGDARKATTLQSFSRIDDAKRLAVGTPLEIPLMTFLRREKDPGKNATREQPAVAVAPPTEPVQNATASVAPDSSSAIAAGASPEAGAPPPPADERRFESSLAAAGRSFADGEYDHAREAMEALRERVTSEGTASDRREWGQLMAFVYIALDRDDDACTAYRAGSPPAGPPRFDPDLISPRIRTVLSNCPAAASSLGRLDNPMPPPQISHHAGTQR
jgi:LysM repeat protein